MENIKDCILTESNKMQYCAASYSDFTNYKDVECKQKYIDRYKINENRTKSDIEPSNVRKKMANVDKQTIQATIIF